MEKNADLMIFRHENDLRMQEFTYLCTQRSCGHFYRLLKDWNYT